MTSINILPEIKKSPDFYISCVNNKGMQMQNTAINYDEPGRRPLPPSLCKHRHGSSSKVVSVQPTDTLLVAVNAAKMTRHALEWALTNVVQPGDHITLLALWPAGGRRLWSLPLFSGDCARRAIMKKGLKNGKLHDVEEEINDCCSSMMQELRALCDAKKAKVSIKVVPDHGEERGAIALEAERIGATWVVLDRHVMKREGKICLEQLHCNLVLVKHSMNSKILRLNLRGSTRPKSCTGPASDEKTDSSTPGVKRAATTTGRKRISSTKRRIATLRSRAPAISFYDGAGSSASSPDVAAGTPFTSGSETDSTAREHLHIRGSYGDPRLVSDNEEGAISDCAEIDFFSEFNAGDHSAILCTPATASPAEGPEAPPEQAAAAVFNVSPFCAGDGIVQPWIESTHTEGTMLSLFREAWKPAPLVTCASSRPNSANTTPKSETLTLTGSSYPRVSRSPSPSNQQQPLARTSRSPSPSKSSVTTAGGGKPSSSSACNLYSGVVGTPKRSHVITSPAQSVAGGSGYSSKAASRRHDFVKCARQTPVSDPATTTNDIHSTAGSTSDRVVTTRELLQKFSEWDHQSSSKLRSSSSTSSHHIVEMDDLNNDLQRTSSVRRAMSLVGGGAGMHPAPPGPPPLCSICQHKAPVFGKPPRRFSYAELELATGGFSNANFLAEGGFGSVHRGVLPDGQAVAVKQHKRASSQGDIEFCSEVEVLSCAQHRNVVMLIGYCIEDRKRLLVYEFICNGSLDSHLYGADRDPLPWAARQKIAVGAARGLRYLHEECRVGCIIHRDMRPNNILLTHDYEPMVGDFGLARWQPDGDLGVQTRVIGTFGYLAPEYAQSGEVTEKADVYSFGVVLLELATGRKAVDIGRPKGQQCLTEWARPLLEDGALQQLLDPRLEGQYAEYELYCSLHAASLCIRKDPNLRPRMSQVLRILEGDVVIDTSGPSTPLYFNGAKLAYQDPPAFNGSRSSRISGEYHRGPRAGSVSPPLISYSGSLLISNSGGSINNVSHHATRRLLTDSRAKLSYETLRASYDISEAYAKRLSFEEST